ncbi:MAG: glycosyl/glycerophosphate transferase, partial [Microbacterium sp.]
MTTTVRIDDDSLVIAGTGTRPDGAELVGPRARVTAKVTGGGKTWKATFPLRASRWGGPELPLPAGRYRVRIDGAAAAELDALELPDTMLPTLRVA